MMTENIFQEGLCYVKTIHIFTETKSLTTVTSFYLSYQGRTWLHDHFPTEIIKQLDTNTQLY